MKRMNFLPEPLLEKLEMKIFLLKAMGLFTIAFFVLILFALLVSLSVSRYQDSLAACEERLADPVFGASDELARLRREAEDSLAQQNRLWEAAGANRLTAEDAYRIIKLLPPELYVWELSLTAEPPGGELQGIALDTDAISQFVERLKASEDFAFVQLVQLQPYGLDRTEFTVVFQWKEGSEP